jgi:hypothetical protein
MINVRISASVSSRWEMRRTMTSRLATVAPVSKPATRVSDHRPYIHAVSAALAARNIVVEVSMVPAQPGFCREAVLDLQANQSAFDQ